MLDSDAKLAVLQRATALLASSRDFEETMEHTIAAFLPVLGDFGFFDLDVGGSVKRTARAHEDPRVEAIVRPTQWMKQERTDMNLCALSTGRAAFHPQIDDAWYQAIAVNEGHLQVLRDLAFGSMISVPMRYRDELLGALTLFHGRSARRYTKDELDFAIDLATLAAPVVANARLLDQQRRITAALQTSEERLRIGMDAAQLGVWDWDVKADRITWSDRVYDLHGLARDQFGGNVEDFSRLVHPDDRGRVAQSIEAALAGGDPYTVEFRVLLPDGRLRWLATRAEVYRDDSGAPARMAGATYDVTERRALLDETAAARRDAESGSRAKDEFLAMLGHELRNPLAPIVSALHLMNVRDATTFRRERDVIQRQVDHMVRLVDDLLDVARITRGNISLVREPLDVVELVEATVDGIRPGLAAQQLTVSVDVPVRPLLVDGDRVRLAQVIGNLLANAAKFSPPGQRITVQLSSSEDDIDIAVIDRGAGIAPELLPNIFELFVQGPQEIAREGGGLGVGLAIVASMVALHGGRVAAESAGLGHGATFRVTLPRLAGAGQAAVAHSGPAPTAAPLRVLVVDDNLDAGELLAELLRARGHEVRATSTATAALAALADTPVDVAILDIGLPEMDGYELAVEIRKRWSRQIRLVALTGYGLPSDRARAMAAGFDEHLVKPVDASALYSLLAAIAAARTHFR
ncbi:MAG: PAS domain-containing protein [Deltaproteobacteria bacterium]|nr:PAS domain-containing protein [Deltaproteobacteria bacterium]